MTVHYPTRDGRFQSIRGLNATSLGEESRLSGSRTRLRPAAGPRPPPDRHSARQAAAAPEQLAVFDREGVDRPGVRGGEDDVVRDRRAAEVRARQAPSQSLPPVAASSATSRPRPSTGRARRAPGIDRRCPGRRARPPGRTRARRRTPSASRRRRAGPGTRSPLRRGSGPTSFRCSPTDRCPDAVARLAVPGDDASRLPAPNTRRRRRASRGPASPGSRSRERRAESPGRTRAAARCARRARGASRCTAPGPGKTRRSAAPACRPTAPGFALPA